MINDMGVTLFDNRTPTTTIDPDNYGAMSGRDITGAFNGSMTLNDIMDMYAWLTMRGFEPNTLLLHPLAWKLFACDPDIREIVLKGGTLASNRMPNGTYSPGWGTSHEGLGLRTTATGAGVATGYGEPAAGPNPKIGANAWVSTLNPLAATFNIAPSYLPTPLKVLVTPFTQYTKGAATISSGTPTVNKTYPTTNVVMLDANACGILVQRNPVQTEEYDDPARDIRAMKIMEKYGFALLEQGKSIVVARDVVIAKNYVFDNSNVVTLQPQDITTALVP